MTKKFLAVVGIAAAVGLLIAFIGFAMVGFDLEKLDMDGEYTQKVYTTSANEATSIKINIDTMKVKVCQREDDSNDIRITYYENNKRKPTINNEDGTVILNDRKEFNNLFVTDGIFSGFKRSRLETIVEIPKNSKALKISVNTSNAAISAENLIADNISLNTSNAAISVSGKFENEVYCETSNSSIKSKNISANSITFNTSNGYCGVENVESNALNVNTSNSAISITNINSSVVKLETSNGYIKLGDVTADISLYAETSNGSISTKGVDSNKIELYTSNGSINSTVVGKEKDFRIDSGTSNGNNNIAGRGNNLANKSLSVYTSNGNINIGFDDEYTVSKGLSTILQANNQ